MNITKKRISICLLGILIIFFITAGLIKKYNNVKTITVAPAMLSATDQKKVSKVKTLKKEKFSSNDEIKKEYGKLETVSLWNGKKYTGAVINTDEIYTIITVEGTIKIPMKDVKIREIIR